MRKLINILFYGYIWALKLRIPLNTYYLVFQHTQFPPLIVHVLLCQKTT